MPQNQNLLNKIVLKSDDRILDVYRTDIILAFIKIVIY